jgi:hypothetical protein
MPVTSLDIVTYTLGFIAALLQRLLQSGRRQAKPEVALLR